MVVRGRDRLGWAQVALAVSGRRVTAPRVCAREELQRPRDEMSELYKMRANTRVDLKRFEEAKIDYDKVLARTHRGLEKWWCFAHAHAARVLSVPERNTHTHTHTFKHTRAHTHPGTRGHIVCTHTRAHTHTHTHTHTR